MARILFLMMFPFMCFSQITPSEDIPVNNLLKEKENLDTKRKASYNLDEIKVRWKKAALENCPGVPCVTNTAPDAPTGLVASVVNSTTVNLTFTAPYNGGSVITSYDVELRWRNASETSGGAIDYIFPTTLPMVFTGLTTGYKYSFMVKAVNAVGVSDPSGLSNWVTPTP